MKLLLPLFILSGLVAFPQPSRDDAPAAIRGVLDRQVVAWNTGNIDEFMKGYWKSDSVVFIGSEVTRGWDQTLARYKKSYPDKSAMGRLAFEVLAMDALCADSYLVTGKYRLTREKDNPQGLFTLVFRRKNGNWVIVYDHTHSLKTG